MSKYERATAAVEQFFQTHTPQEAVAKIKKIAPYAFSKAARAKNGSSSSSSKSRKSK